MATVVVAFDGTRLTNAESESDGGTWDDWGKSTSPTQETDLVLEGTNDISNKVSATTGGVEFEDDTTSDFTTPQVCLFKTVIANPGAMSAVAEGHSVQLGSSTSDYYNYYLFGSQVPYPAVGGWQVTAIDPNVTSHRDEMLGTTPTLSAIDYYGIFADMTGSAKSDNVVSSCIDIFNSGEGLTLTRGDSTDDDGTFQDFVDNDEGLNSGGNGRYMIAAQFGGDAIRVRGTLTIGESATATEFTDTLRTLEFIPDRTDAGFGGVALDLQNASTVVDITLCSFKSVGTGFARHFFHSTNDINGTTDRVTITNHGLVTGEAVLYSKEGGSATTGMTNATEYFVEVIDSNTVEVHTGLNAGRQEALTAATQENLSAAGNEQHSFQKQPDTRADFTVTGTSGSATLDQLQFVAFRNLTLRSVAPLTSSVVVGCELLTQNDAALTSNTFSQATTEVGEAFIDSDNPADISSNDFTASEGHAIECSTAGAYAFANNTFTGYGGDRAQFSPDQVFTSEVLVTESAHGFSDGDAVYYNKEGNVGAVGLTDGNLYYVDSQSSTSLTLHLTKSDAIAGTNDISLTTDATANLFHSLYSADAAFFNNCTSVAEDSYSESNKDTEWKAYYPTTNSDWAQSFQPLVGGAITSIDMFLGSVGSPTGTMKIDLYNSTGTPGTDAVPTGSPIATSEVIDCTDFSPTLVLTRFYFTSAPTMSATDYFWALDVINITGDVSNAILVGVDTSSPPSNNNFAGSTDGGSSWSPFTTAEMCYYARSNGTIVLNVTGTAPTVRNAPNAWTVVNVSVDVEINGLTEGARVSVVGDGGAADGTVILEGYADSAGEVSGTFGGTTPQAVKINARSSGIPLNVMNYDSSLTTYNDFTTEAREQTAAGDVSLLPAAGVAVSDLSYVGGLDKFGRVVFDIETAGTTYVGTWEYYNGSWTAITDETDNTSGFQTSGWNELTFTAPSDWTTTTIDGNGPYYFIRYRITTGGGTVPTANYVSLRDTVRYQPFFTTGTIQSSTGLTVTAVWLEDTNAP